LTQGEVRQAIDAWVRSTWFASRAAARAIPIADQLAPAAHHVVLETFTESRTVDEVDRPHRGETLPPATVAEVDAWAVAVPSQKPFEAGAQELEVPGTAHVASCEQCSASGKTTCMPCEGSGEVTSTSFSDENGSSQTTRGPCRPCEGSGRVCCRGCDGETRVVTSKRLTVRWMVHRADQAVGTRGFPADLISNAAETEVSTEEGEALKVRVGSQAGPFRGGESLSITPEVDEATNEMLAAHAFGGQTRVARQRLSVRAIPLFEVPYEADGEKRTLWIFGADQQVYAPKFPLSRPRMGIATVVWAAICATPIAWWLMVS
jgi:hypothetical protein